MNVKRLPEVEEFYKSHPYEIRVYLPKDKEKTLRKYKESEYAIKYANQLLFKLENDYLYSVLLDEYLPHIDIVDINNNKILDTIIFKGNQISASNSIGWALTEWRKNYFEPLKGSTVVFHCDYFTQN